MTAIDQQPIIVLGDEQAQVDLSLPDGGLRPVVGVRNLQVFRASRGAPHLADGDGWTYAHHQDLAAWRGRLYAAWAMTPADEDVPPYKVVYATSTDGVDWSAPADLFPRASAWACRFYFRLAGNGRMLAFCAGRSAAGDVTEAVKRSLLVREILPDHALGPVFTLIGPLPDLPPLFTASSDPAFVEACQEAVGDRLLLEQQDYGNLLGDRRMRWHGDPGLDIPGWCKFGKAFCFYRRADGVLVGLCKMGFATISQDGGETWSQPVQPPTLVAGSAKVWGQRTSDGRYALAYDPDRGVRHPLALVHGDDGIVFRDLRIVHGEVPRLRYAGRYKDSGPQYVRGLAPWADDGSFADRGALWLVYSVNREDIWVARVPLPVQAAASSFPDDDLSRIADGAFPSGWNLYRPRWTTVGGGSIGGRRGLVLGHGDPCDYARAIRVLPDTRRLRLDLRLTAAQAEARCEIELCDPIGRRPIRIVVDGAGSIFAADGATPQRMGGYAAGRPISLQVAADLDMAGWSLAVDGGAERRLSLAETGCTCLQRLSLRTGAWRGIDRDGPVAVQDDAPLPRPMAVVIERVTVRAG